MTSDSMGINNVARRQGAAGQATITLPSHCFIIHPITYTRISLLIQGLHHQRKWLLVHEGKQEGEQIGPAVLVVAFLPVQYRGCSFYPISASWFSHRGTWLPPLIKRPPPFTDSLRPTTIERPFCLWFSYFIISSTLIIRRCIPKDLKIIKRGLGAVDGFLWFSWNRPNDNHRLGWLIAGGAL